MKPHIPDFDQLRAVLTHEKPDRPVLFEFFLNDRLYAAANGGQPRPEDAVEHQLYLANAMASYGYDHCQAVGCPLVFIQGPLHKKQTRSLNENHFIQNWDDFENYPWPDPDALDYSVLDKVKGKLPGNMKLLFSSAGILETAMEMIGYESLCYMIYEEPELVEAVFNRIGELHVKHYSHALEHDTVGLIFGNDDWGFNTHTLLSPTSLRELVFPWYKKIVAMAHSAGRVTGLHSCGKLDAVMDDIIHDIQFDGKHSYQDKITPVEQAYTRWGKDIAILGGLDMDFLARSTPETIRRRAEAMLEQTVEGGSYALGSGNSIADFVPDENFHAMISAVETYR